MRRWLKGKLVISFSLRGLIEDLVFNNQTLAEIKEDLIQYISTLDINISTEDINDLFEIYEMI